MLLISVSPFKELNFKFYSRLFLCYFDRFQQQAVLHFVVRFDSIDATHSTALVWRAETTKTNSFKAKNDHSTYLHTLVLFSHRFWWFRCDFDFSAKTNRKRSAPHAGRRGATFSILAVHTIVLNQLSEAIGIEISNSRACRNFSGRSCTN